MDKKIYGFSAISVTRLGFSLIALPTVLIIITYLANKILTTDLTNSLQVILGYVDKIIGTRVTNLILVGVSTLLVVRVIKRFNRFITGNEDK